MSSSESAQNMHSLAESSSFRHCHVLIYSLIRMILILSIGNLDIAGEFRGENHTALIAGTFALAFQYLWLCKRLNLAIFNFV